jgi:hypothetical protein
MFIAIANSWSDAKSRAVSRTKGINMAFIIFVFLQGQGDALWKLPTILPHNACAQLTLCLSAASC